MEDLKSKATENKAISNKRETFAVEGMSCSSCANTVQRLLSRMEGVKSANVNFSTSSATVEYDPSLVTPAKVREAVGKTGYKLGEQTSSSARNSSSGSCC
jgi:Cu+-exporting ATPase